MKIKITYYLDVASSWCFLAEPAWAALKDRYAGRVDFDWKIALMDAAGLPTSREQLAWFYRRSGTIMRSPFMLSTEWLQPGATEYPVRNCVAEAAAMASRRISGKPRLRWARRRAKSTR